jgi:hypothetical protein
MSRFLRLAHVPHTHLRQLRGTTVNVRRLHGGPYRVFGLLTCALLGWRIRICRLFRPFLIAMASLGLLLGWWSGARADETGDGARYREAVGRALRLLPRQPLKVVIIEADAAPHLLQKNARHIQAFVIPGNRAVYLLRQGVSLQQALKGPGVFDYVLATVIWHEMAHIDGADEVHAQMEEEKLWTQFVVARRVDADQGLRYLALLKNRR